MLTYQMPAFACNLCSGDGAKDDFSTERKLLLSDLRALQWGFTSGLLWLVAFRRAPNNIRKYYVHRSTSVPASQFLADRPFLYLGLLATHWGLSYWVGASVTVALSDRTPMAEKLRNIPLTEGRSVVSDKMCPDFISTYDTIKEQGFDWNNVERKLPASEARNQMSNLSNLYNVAAFVTNCKKRNAYEDQLRNERGVLHNAPVAIPSPGVPVETEVEGSDVDEFDRVQNEIDFDDGMN